MKPVTVAVLELGNPALPRDTDQQASIGRNIFASDIRSAIPLLEAENPDVVVIHQSTEWGRPPAFLEVAHVLHDEFKKRWRTVAWGRNLLGGAGLAVWSLPEIYAHHDAQIGVLKWEYGGGDPSHHQMEVANRQLDEIADLGGHDRLIGRAMRTLAPLSAKVDAAGRAVEWFASSDGPVLVNSPDRMLVLKAPRAAELGILSGVADTREELARLLKIDSPVWVGRQASDALAAAAVRRAKVLAQIEQEWQRVRESVNGGKAGAAVNTEVIRDLYRQNPELFLADYGLDARSIDPVLDSKERALGMPTKPRDPRANEDGADRRH